MFCLKTFSLTFSLKGSNFMGRFGLPYEKCKGYSRIRKYCRLKHIIRKCRFRSPLCPHFLTRAWPPCLRLLLFAMGRHCDVLGDTIQPTIIMKQAKHNISKLKYLFVTAFPQKGNTFPERGKNTGIGKRLTEFLDMSLHHTYQLSNVLLMMTMSYYY